jgi:threonine dehydrogenase-like Zn-dependent dehydrogenase
MKAITFQGSGNMEVETVPDPQIINPRDAIVQITSTCICGSDLHMYDGFIPTVRKGDIFGHEFMGHVVEVGPGVTNVQVGDRVLVPFNISCGNCYYCQHEMWSLCDNSNPNAGAAEEMYGYSPAGLFGYSHLFGGYAGGQAEYARVPFADVGCFKVPDNLPDDAVVFLTDIFPTGYMAAENCDIKPGDIVAIWGAGPVAQFAIRSAILLGAEQVIAIDRVPERLEMARAGGAYVLNYEDVDVIDALKELTGGRGPDAVIDAVGMEAHGTYLDYWYDRVMQKVRAETDRPVALRMAIQACRKGGTVSIPGVYGGIIDKIPFGAAFNKGLTMKMGQTHVHRYVRPLMERIANGEIDPSFVVTHKVPLEQAPEMYKTFRDKEDGCIKVVLKPGMNGNSVLNGRSG